MTFLTEERHAAIANDLPIITDLIGHHCIFISVAACEAEQVRLKNIAWRTEHIFAELATLVQEMKALAENEYPGAAWLSGYDRSAESED
jgi:hypothetical protein